MAEERSDLEKRSNEILGNKGMDDTDQTDHLKDQIEETRSQMGETIEAIQDKLSFANISEQVSGQVNNAVESAKLAAYDATIGKAANIMKNISNEFSSSSIVRTAKSNPIPFILIGLGAGVLAYQGFSAKGQKGGSHRLKLAGHNPRESDAIASQSGSAVEKLAVVTDKVSEVAGTAYDKVSGAIETAYSGAGDLGAAVRNQYETHIEENPLAVGAVALAVGAAIGMALPSTRYEIDLMGDARQGLVEKANNTATELIDTTKEAVRDASRNLAAEARSAITD